MMSKGAVHATIDKGLLVTKASNVLEVNSKTGDAAATAAKRLINDDCILNQKDDGKRQKTLSVERFYQDEN